MKNNHFLQISCLGLMALLHGVSLNESTLAKANQENTSSSTLSKNLLKNLKDSHSDWEITPATEGFTYHLAHDLTNYNLEETPQYFTQSTVRAKTNVDLIFDDD